MNHESREDQKTEGAGCAGGFRTDHHDDPDFKRRGLFCGTDGRNGETQTPEHVLQRASWTHFYVAEDAGAIIGCGAIGPYWGKEDESSLFSIFVHPDYQGKGIGRAIVEPLEQDEFALRARRIEIPASITGLPFYQKMGYSFKNGNTELDEEQLYRLEKIRG